MEFILTKGGKLKSKKNVKNIISNIDSYLSKMKNLRITQDTQVTTSSDRHFSKSTYQL